MKRLLLASLVLSVSTSIAVVGLASLDSSAASAQTETQAAISETTSSSIRGVTPFNLVYLARNGYFKDQGIPSHAALVAGIRDRDITAEVLVQGAIEDNRLTAEALDDRHYLRAVDRYLREFVNQSSGRS